MKHTKDEIEINITKKDRIYLSIILSLIFIVAIVCILVPRYYQLQNNQQTNIPNNQAGNSSNSNQNSQDTDSNQDTSTSVNQAYKNHYSTLVINSLKTVGMPYSTLANHLDRYNILDVTGLNITTTELANLESLALPIYNALNNYINNGFEITATLINNDNTLYSQIVEFSNALNELPE